MKTTLAALTLAVMATVALAGEQSRTFTGVISDSMCLRDHTMMKVTPVSKCVHECIKASKDIRYSLIVGKTDAYRLNDPDKPARFAGQKVRLKGVLNAKTKVIEVESIESAR